jgi:hypothetical protein
MIVLAFCPAICAGLGPGGGPVAHDGITKAIAKTRKESHRGVVLNIEKK